MLHLINRSGTMMESLNIFDTLLLSSRLKNILPAHLSVSPRESHWYVPLVFLTLSGATRNHLVPQSQTLRSFYSIKLTRAPGVRNQYYPSLCSPLGVAQKSVIGTNKQMLRLLPVKTGNRFSWSFRHNWLPCADLSTLAWVTVTWISFVPDVVHSSFIADYPTSFIEASISAPTAEVPAPPPARCLLPDGRSYGLQPRFKSRPLMFLVYFTLCVFLN